MLPAVITAFLYALSAICSQRAVRGFGPLRANAIRLTVACLLLGMLTAIIDGQRGMSSLHPDVLAAFLLSGAAGFGAGDIAVFLAYPRLGSRLTLLVVYCSAVLFAAAGDHWMLGIGLQPWQGVAVGVTLAGLFLGLWPGRPADSAPPAGIMGITLAVGGGAGQGIGTVLSGRANEIAASEGMAVHGISQAFQRSLAGAAAAVAAFLLASWLWPGSGAPASPRHGSRPWGWMAATALCGPVLGVSCYQWARLLIPSTMVVAVAATSSLLVIPLARVMEKERTSPRGLAGALLAVGGVIWLCLQPRG
jgi:drug/metabolite transporter (DMT)-like permease